MASYYNVQTNNRREQSKYPFDASASLLLGKYTFPSHMIKSLGVQVKQGRFPLYLGSISAIQDRVVFQIKDITANTLGSIQLLSSNTGRVIDTLGCACGGIAFQPDLYKWCLQLISTTRYKHMSLLSSQLPLASQVITCLYYTGYRGLSFSGRYLGSDVTLNFQRNAIPAIDNSTKKLRVDVWGDYSLPATSVSDSTVYLTQVNGIDMTGGNLIIKHKTLSDVRAVTKQNKLLITGVKDVTGNQ